MAQYSEGMSNPKLYIKAMTQMFERLRIDLRTQIGDLADRVDKMESSYYENSSINNTKNWGRHEQEDEISNSGKNGHMKVNSNLWSIKMKIASFQGKSDVEAYLEWEKNVEFIFECHQYSKVKKVKLATAKFTNYALVWWDQLVTSRRRNHE